MQAGFDGHQAALGKSAQRDLVGGKILGPQLVEQFKQQLAAAVDARGDVAGIIKPGPAAVVFVGRVDEEIIQPGQIERAGQPAPAFDRIAKAVEHHENPAGIFFGGGNEFSAQHQLLVAPRNLPAAASVQSMTALRCASVRRAAACSSVYFFGGISR